MGELGYTYNGLSGKSKGDFGHGEAKYITYINIFENPLAQTNGVESIEIDHSQNEVKYGDVFFTTSSETPEEVGMSSVWLGNEKDIYLNSFCFGYRLIEPINYIFFAYLLRSPSFRSQIIILAQGISRYNISKNKVMELIVHIPSLEEQSKLEGAFLLIEKLITLHQRKQYEAISNHVKTLTLMKSNICIKTT